MTTSAPENLYWDSCVFMAYLNDERAAYGRTIDDVGQYLREAKDGRFNIYCSAICLAEVLPRYLRVTAHRKFKDTDAVKRAREIIG